MIENNKIIYKGTTLVDFNALADKYTKAEIDAMIASVFHYKGSVATYEALTAITSPSVGDCYNVDADGNNYAYSGTAWDKLSGTIDLTNYLTKDEINTALALKQDKLTAGDNITITNNVISAADGTEINIMYHDFEAPTSWPRANIRESSDNYINITLSLTDNDKQYLLDIVKYMHTNNKKVLLFANFVDYDGESSVGNINFVILCDIPKYNHSDFYILNNFYSTYLKNQFNEASSDILSIYNRGSIIFTYDSETTYNPVSFSTMSITGYTARLLSENNTVSYTPTGDYNPATKKYVDDSVKTSLIPYYTYESTNSYNMDETDNSFISSIITKAYARGDKQIIINRNMLDTTRSVSELFSVIVNSANGIQDKPTAIYIYRYMSANDIQQYMSSGSLNTYFYFPIYKFTVTWTDSTAAAVYDSIDATFTKNNSYLFTTSSSYYTDLAKKTYVDSKPTTYAGYDATKTQVLKNVNGTLTWVTEA